MKAIAEKKGYLVKRLNAGNLADLAKLHTAVYGRVQPVDFFSKKYDTAYTGLLYIGYIAYNQQMMPIAYYGVIPCLMWSDNGVVLTAQSADTMTHPEYRKKGLFVQLARQTYELCRDSGIRFVFGFPNQNSARGFLINLQWQKTDTMDCFVIRVKAVPLERMTVKIPSLKGLYTRYKKNVLKRYQEKTPVEGSSLLADGYDGILRDARYFQYKSYSGTEVISIGGITLWIKISSILLVGDILGVKDNLVEVINELQKLAVKLGLRQIHFHTSPGTRLHQLFKAHYQAIPSFMVSFKVIESGGSFERIKFTSADIDTF